MSENELIVAVPMFCLVVGLLAFFCQKKDPRKDRMGFKRGVEHAGLADMNWDTTTYSPEMSYGGCDSDSGNCDSGDCSSGDGDSGCGSD